MKIKEKTESAQIHEFGSGVFLIVAENWRWVRKVLGLGFGDEGRGSAERKLFIMEFDSVIART